MQTTAGIAAAGAATGAAASDGADAASGYGDVVYLEEVGADPTGGASITPYLERYAGDDTLLVLDDGRYRMDEQFRLTGFTNFGIVGDGATIVPDDYWSFDGIACFKLGTASDPGRDLRIGDLTFDFRAPTTGLRTIQAQVADGLDVRNVSVLGEHDTGTWGPALFDVVEPGGYGRVENFRAPYGGAFSADTPGSINVGPTGMLVTRFHRGHLRLEHCRLDRFPDNGLYAGNANGRVEVVGGYYRNNHISNVRLGGDGSGVYWAQIVVDDNGDSGYNQRGIRLDSGTDLTVAGTAVRLPQPNGAGISVLDECGTATIENTSVDVGPARAPAIRVSGGADQVVVLSSSITDDGSGYTVYLEGDGGGDGVAMSYVDITGDASGDGGRAAIWCDRDGSAFRWVDVDQPGGHDRRAIDLRADDCIVYRGSYVARNFPIVNHGAGSTVAETEARSYDDSQGVLTYESALTVARCVIDDGILNKDAGAVDAYGNEYV